jgi:hypothetical protein
MIEPKCTEILKLIKIEGKLYKNLIFGVDRSKTQILMIDEISGLHTAIFEINKQFGYEDKNRNKN